MFLIQTKNKRRRRRNYQIVCQLYIDEYFLLKNDFFLKSSTLIVKMYFVTIFFTYDLIWKIPEFAFQLWLSIIWEIPCDAVEINGFIFSPACQSVIIFSTLSLSYTHRHTHQPPHIQLHWFSRLTGCGPELKGDSCFLRQLSQQLLSVIALHRNTPSSPQTSLCSFPILKANQIYTRQRVTECDSMAET